MDQVKINKLLYRIIQGRLRIPRFDPVLYIYEPSVDILEESYEIYNQVYEESYFKGLYIKKELKEVLFENDLWSPLDDREAEKVKDQIDDLKVEAFQNNLNVKKLSGIKANIRYMERTYEKLKGKFSQLDHISCEGAAEFSRSIWVISKTILDKDRKPQKNPQYSLYSLLSFYNSNLISVDYLRAIARSDSFRPMWSLAKKGNSLFGDCHRLTNPPKTINTQYGLKYAFRNCYSLTHAGPYDLSESLDNTNMFENCNSLRTVDISGINSSISFRSTFLGSGELTKIINNLGTTSASLDIRYTYGAYELHPDTIAIATNKGWSVFT